MVYPHSYRTEHSETKTSNSVYGEYYAYSISKKIPIDACLLKLLHYCDSNRGIFLKDLEDAVKIKSVSGDIRYRNDVINMIKFTEGWLKKLGIKYECFNIGWHELGGKKVRLPPIILGSLGNDPNKKTVCIYGHLDVLNPNMDDWDSDPWQVVEHDRRFYGNGVANGKGVIICWFHALQGFKDSGIELPVNIKFIIESMYNQQNEGLAEFLPTRKIDFFNNVDYIVNSDSEWIGEKYPCLIYGTVGIIHFDIIIEKMSSSKTDPRDDMKAIFENIVDNEEHILIPHFDDWVQQITPDEEKMYEQIAEFDPAEIRDALPPFKRRWDQVKLLMHFWRLPSIYVGDIEECVCDKKDQNVIKRHMILKIVPRQMVEKSIKLTTQHINNLVKSLNIENKVTCELISATRPWYEDFTGTNYEAARRATIQIYKEDPNLIREDRDRLPLTILDRILEKSILFLPLTCKGSNIGEANENVPSRNFYEGTKLFMAYLRQLGELTKMNDSKNLCESLLTTVPVSMGDLHGEKYEKVYWRTKGHY